MRPSSLVFTTSIAAAIAGTAALALGWETYRTPVNVLTVILGFYAFWGFCVIWTSVDNHMSSLARLQRANAEIEAAEAALEDVKGLAAEGQTGLPEQLMALQQDSNPVTRYMNLVDNAISTVRNAKERKASAEADIAARAAGPLGIVPWMFGTEI